MFKVIRIPTKYSRTIKRFSKEEINQLLSFLIDIGDGKIVDLPDNIVGDTVGLIYGEWMNMEKKNGTKIANSLIKYHSDYVGQENASNSEAIVEYSIIKDNKVEYNINSEVAPKVATLEDLIKINFNKGFIKCVQDKYNIKDEEFKEESFLFLKYWNAILLKGKNKGKPKWMGEDTFDVKLRFYNWMRNNKKWSKEKKKEPLNEY